MIIATVIGEKRLTSFLKAFTVGLPFIADETVHIAAEQIAEYGRDFVPVDTGATRESIRTEKSSDGWWVIADRGGDHPGVPVFLEFGTIKMQERPFFRPAVEIVTGTSAVSAEVKAVGGLFKMG